MQIRVSELRSDIANLDELIAAEREALRRHRERLRDLRQEKRLKLHLLRQLEERGLDALDLPS